MTNSMDKFCFLSRKFKSPPLDFYCNFANPLEIYFFSFLFSWYICWSEAWLSFFFEIGKSKIVYNVCPLSCLFSVCLPLVPLRVMRI